MSESTTMRPFEMGAFEIGESGPGTNEGSRHKHVDHVLTAEFDVDAGPLVRHQYPEVLGDRQLMAELMLPDQIHNRTEDWTIFFLYKRKNSDQLEYYISDEQDKEEATKVYVLNLVNTKFDSNLRRGAQVKAMAIVTRHPFFHVFKPLLVLALDDYFKRTTTTDMDPLDSLSKLYSSLNAMDLSRVPQFSSSEKLLLASSEHTSLFIEKFDEITSPMSGLGGSQTCSGDNNNNTNNNSNSNSNNTNNYNNQHHHHNNNNNNKTEGTFYFDLKNNNQRMVSRHATLVRDTHIYETSVQYNGMKIPIKVPTDYSRESVGDFSLVRLVALLTTGMKNNVFQTTHPELTPYGAGTPPLLVLIFALLTQKRVLFVGVNTPSGEVADHVLACCSLASGGGAVLRSFTASAFPYTDLSKVDDLLANKGYIAGVKNPAFERHTDWWDVLVDIEAKTMRISPEVGCGTHSGFPTLSRAQTILIGAGGAAGGAGGGAGSAGMAPAGGAGGAGAGLTGSAGMSLSSASMGSSDGVGSSSGSNLVAQSASASSSTTSTANQVCSEDYAFVEELHKMVTNHYGETSVRRMCKEYLRRFVRMSINYEEAKYGATNLWPSLHDPSYIVVPGYGYTWVSDSVKMADLAQYASVIEGWRASRSYKFYIDDQRELWDRPPKSVVDYEYLIDRLRLQQLSHPEAAHVYGLLAAHTQDYDDINRLLAATTSSSSSLFYVAMGLFHADAEVRVAVARLLQRIENHSAGRVFFQSVSFIHQLAYQRVLRSTVDPSRISPANGKPAPGQCNSHILARPHAGQPPHGSIPGSIPVPRPPPPQCYSGQSAYSSQSAHPHPAHPAHPPQPPRHLYSASETPANLGTSKFVPLDGVPF